MENQGRKNCMPIPAFYFKVQFQDRQDRWVQVNTSFQEVSGLPPDSVEVDVPIQGGENGFAGKCPIKCPNLKLRRALEPMDEYLASWINDCLRGDKHIKALDLVISLIDSQGEVLHTWHCPGVYPINMESVAFYADRSQLAFDIIELACNRIQRIK